jgi:hypothetical protein
VVGKCEIVSQWYPKCSQYIYIYIFIYICLISIDINAIERAVLKCLVEINCIGVIELQSVWLYNYIEYVVMW